MNHVVSDAGNVVLGMSRLPSVKSAGFPFGKSEALNLAPAIPVAINN